MKHTKLLLDDLEYFLLIKLFRKTLHSGQGFATIALCKMMRHYLWWIVGDDYLEHTLDPNMDVVLRLFGLPCILVGFGEGVCTVA